MERVKNEEVKDVCAFLEREAQYRKRKSVGIWLRQYKLAKAEAQQHCVVRVK